MVTEHNPTPVAVLAAIAVLAGASLAYELILIRLFSIIQWHHYAYMIISLALLGYGMSGTVLSLWGAALLRRFASALCLHMVAFAGGAVACFWAAQALDFNPLALLWEWDQWPRLAGIYLLLSIPFLAAANAIALTMMYFRTQLARVYGADLLGAALGVVGAVALMGAAAPALWPGAVAAVGCLAAGLAGLGLGGRASRTVLPAVLAGVLLVLYSGDLFPWRASQYKPLSQALQVMGARLTDRRSGPLGDLSVLQNTQVPVRFAPGLSLNASTPLPEQRALYVDGDTMTAVTRFDGRHVPDFVSMLPSAVGYALRPRQRALVLGAGGGMDVLQALYFGTANVDVVEGNPQLLDLLVGPLGAFTGHLFTHPGVRIIQTDMRAYAERSDERYDLIQMAQGGTLGGAGGVAGAREDYTLTREALRAYLEQLTPGGVLSLNRWIQLPPRDGVKVLATAIAALRHLGVARPAEHLAWIRSWNTSTLLVSKGAFGDGDVARLLEFCRQRGFDLVWYPGMPPDAANRVHKLARPLFHEAARELLGPRGSEFVRAYPFQVAPASDDRPYHQNYFRWRTLPHLLETHGGGGAAQVELGYLILVVTLVQALLLSVVLIVLPLWHRRGRAGNGWRIAAYFGAVGFAFMAMEIGRIQQFMRFLAHPTYAFAVLLFAFLFFAGLGSLAASRLGSARKAVWVLAAIALLGLLQSWLLAPVFETFIAAPLALRALLTLALIGPLAFLMGMPFPLGLRALSASPNALPWAWALNGCASVCGAILASLLAMHLGLQALILIALASYAAAALVFPRQAL